MEKHTKTNVWVLVPRIHVVNLGLCVDDGGRFHDLLAPRSVVLSDREHKKIALVHPILLHRFIQRLHNFLPSSSNPVRCKA